MQLKSFLSSYHAKIEAALKTKVDSFGGAGLLQEACAYSLLNGGRRFRPALVLAIADGLGFGVDVMEAALGVECFHTASLIADDLPCMDNDDFRRNKPSLHKQFGEAPALLVSYALIAAGYECLIKNGRALALSLHPLKEQADFLTTKAIQNVCENTGMNGASIGQLFDLQPPAISLENLKDVFQKKTGTLFEISFVLGWIFGGGELEKLEKVKSCAAHFGIGFQVADDFGDQESDLKTGRVFNTVNLFGEAKALAILEEEKNGFLQDLKDLGLDKTPLIHLSDIFLKPQT